jgi:hypothetical protein
VSFPPGVLGVARESPKSWNSPGFTMPSLPSPVQMTVSTSSVIFSPSIGLAALRLLMVAVQPGTGCVETNAKPGGNCTSTFVVPALWRSFGTRTSSRVKAPAGASEG